MSLDARALITCNLGPALDGSGWSEDFAQDVGLISVKGQLNIDGIITPARGTVVEIGYIKAEPTMEARTLTRFYQRLHVLSSFADPYDNRTTVDVGCQIELQRSRRDRTLFRAAANPPAWWAALPEPLQKQVAPPIQAQAVIQFCLDALGIPLAAGSATSPDWFLRDSFDLADGYIQVIDDLLRSANLLGHMTPAGELLVEQISLTSGTGPVLRRGDLISLLPIQAGEQGAETVTVDFDAIEAPKGIVLAQNREVDENGDPVDEEERDEQRRRNWELTRTTSPPKTHLIPYITQAGARQVAQYAFTPFNEVLTQYAPFSFLGDSGELETQEVVVRSTSTSTECFAAANPNLGTSFLENGLTFNGSAPNPRVTITESQYAQGPTGPRLVREVTTDYQTEVEFAGSLGITDYVIGGEAYNLTAALVVVGVTDTTTEVNEFDGLTKRTTTRFRATGRRQPGNQVSAVSSRSAANVDELRDVFRAGLTLVNEGTEVQVNRGREVGIQTRPSQQARSGTYELGQFQDRSDGPEGVVRSGSAFTPQTVTLEMRFGEGSGDAWASTTFRLPYSPDDFIRGSQGTSPSRINRELVRGFARDRALEYGRLRNAMVFGHANGVQVQTVPWNLPSRPFAPVFIEAAGLSTAFRTNGRSWEIRGGAVVVSSDLMLVGTLGRLSGAEPTPWMPLPAAPSQLPLLGVPVGSGGIEPGNTIPVPDEFDPNDPGDVWDDLPDDEPDTLGANRTATALAPPFTISIPVTARVRPGVTVQAFPFAFDDDNPDQPGGPRTRVTAAVRVGCEVESFIPLTGDAAPPVIVTAQPLAPVIYARPRSLSVRGQRAVFGLGQGDPLFDDVVLYMEFNQAPGANEPQVFTDLSTYNHQVTAIGDPVVQEEQIGPQEVLTSLVLDGASGLRLPESDALVLDGDFTIEIVAAFSRNIEREALLSGDDNLAFFQRFYLTIPEPNTLRSRLDFALGDDAENFQGSQQLTIETTPQTFYKLTWERKGDEMRLYSQDDILPRPPRTAGLITVPTAPVSLSGGAIGGRWATDTENAPFPKTLLNPFEGKITTIRITKAARYEGLDPFFYRPFKDFFFVIPP